MPWSRDDLEKIFLAATFDGNWRFIIVSTNAFLASPIS
jgi:hypothetical protein